MHAATRDPAEKAIGIWEPEVLHDALWIPLDPAEGLCTCCISADATLVALAGCSCCVKLLRCSVTAATDDADGGAAAKSARTDPLHAWQAYAQQRDTAARSASAVWASGRTWEFREPNRGSLTVEFVAELTAPAFVRVEDLAIGPRNSNLAANISSADAMVVWNLAPPMLAHYVRNCALPALVRAPPAAILAREGACFSRPRAAATLRCESALWRREAALAGELGDGVGRCCQLPARRICVLLAWPEAGDACEAEAGAFVCGH